MFDRKITIYNKTIENSTVKWEKKVFNGTVYEKQGISINASDDIKNNYIIVRILCGESICRPGDRIVTREAESDIPPENSYTVTNVTENFIGSRAMHHVKIQAE